MVKAIPSVSFSSVWTINILIEAAESVDEHSPLFQAC